MKNVGLLDKKSRVERLREIVEAVKQGERFSAFDLAVKYDISINVVYRDVRALLDEGLIPESFEFARKGEVLKRE
jgi:DeoR/GlpR family transcriptional regulator of sugar metabolism